MDNVGNVLGTGKTDGEGFVLVQIRWTGSESLEGVQVKATKKDYAPSVVKGLNVTGALGASAQNQMVTMAANRAMMDPSWTAVPNINVTFTLPDGTTPLDISNAGAIPFQAHVTSDKYWDVMYAGVDYVPWAGVRDGSANDANIKNVTFDLSFAGKNGTVPVHFVVYDQNRARLDLVYFANITNAAAPVTASASPTGLYLVSWTSDANVQYYVDPRDESPLVDRSGKMLRAPLVSTNAKRGAPDGCNIFVQIAWTAPAAGDAPIGYNIYRSETSATTGFRKIAFRSVTNGFDSGYGLEPGKTSWYKVRSVYADGTESADSNIMELVPLDIFQVELITPAHGAVNVSQTPVFSWKPVKQGTSETAQVGMGVTPEASIIYDSLLWIYDCVHNDQQHICVDVATAGGFKTYGPKIISIPFLSGTYYDEVDEETYDLTWIEIPEGQGAVLYPYSGLEAYKSYEWGMDYAAATYIRPPDVNGGFYIAFSVSVDLGYGYDRWNNDAENYNGFTTGKDLPVTVSKGRGE